MDGCYMIKTNKKIKIQKLQEIYMRDPFIFPDKTTGKYYLFGTTRVCDGAANVDPHFEVYVSDDLINFSGPYAAFLPKRGFWGVKHFWAPEVHEFNGKYYMFVSCKGGIGEDRGTGILVADSPGGPYQDHSHGHVTLPGHECLDGTLFVDREGRPWIVFCHEWTEIFYGKICAMPLSMDLKSASPDAVITIVDTKTDNLPWIRKMRDPRVEKEGYLTDAPFMYRTKSGRLIMLWSSYRAGSGYVVAAVYSESGEISGPWHHESELLMDANIGHCSIFTDFEGRLMLCGHTNDTEHGAEYPVFIRIGEKSKRELFFR